MVLCEAIMLSIITLLGVYSSYTDIKKGVIKNSALIISGSLGIIINGIYFYFFCREIIVLYMINLLVVSVFSIAMYGFHFWAAGDSKLLICFIILFPSRFYENDLFTFAPGTSVIIYIFLIAYVYIIFDSIIQFFKKKKFYSGNRIGMPIIKDFLIGYLISFLYLRGLSELLRVLIGTFYEENRLVFAFANLFVAILIYSKPIFRKWYMIVVAVIINLTFIGKFSFQPSLLYGYGILFLALILRHLLNGYNYQEINTDEVKKGMVLSYATVLGFSSSRVKGLPNKTYEDMRSRIDEAEVEAIKRWKNSSQGKEKITIVRKIPFAIFIFLGMIIYFVIHI